MFRRKRRSDTRWLRLGLVILVLALAVWFLFLRTEKSAAPGSGSRESSSEDTAEEKKPQFPFVDLQATVERWDSSHGGTSSVVIYDIDNGKIAASLNPHRIYFGASLYKLYVAYEGYLKIVDGTYDLDDPYLSDYTRGKCLDIMIRESYSPCAEKMWVELGKEALTAKMKSYGLKNTNLSSLQTTAYDSNLILRKLAKGDELDKQHTELYLDSMKTQPALYRRGLPKGFTDITVYNKVGWNLTLEWHDAAIIELSDGHRYVITVLTENVGMNNIAALAKALQQKISG